MKFEIQINKQGDNSTRYYEHMRSNPDDKNNNKKQDSFGQALRITWAKCKKNITLNCGFWQEWSVSKLVLARAAMSRSSRQNTRLIQSLLSNRFRIRSGMTKSVNHFLTSLPNNLFTFKPAFTLAEVLITLGIIGIVAAMTIPTLIQKNFEKQTVAKLRETQSILSQAIRMAEEEYGSMEGWGITGYDEESAVIIANNLKTTLKLALDCGVEDTEAHCAPNKMYQFLKGGNNNNFATDRTMYKIVLTNGTTIYIRGNNGTTSANAVFYVDTNGKSSPNTWGKDLFQFSARPDGLYPTGHPSKSSETTATSCHKEGSGFGCAYYVLNNGNMNYLH